MNGTREQKGESRAGGQKRPFRTKEQKEAPISRKQPWPQEDGGRPPLPLKPDSLNTRLQVKAQMLSDSLYERRKSLHKTMGEPLKSGELSATERKTQYQELIASREMLVKALAGAAIVGRDGRLRLSTAMVDAFVELSDARS